MNKFTKALEKYLIPIAEKFSKNRYLVAIRDAFLISLPFTMFGSIFTAIANLPFLENVIGADLVASFQGIIGPTFTLTMGIISFITAAGIGYSLSKHYKVNAIYGSIVSLVSFIMITPIEMTMENGTVVSNVLPLSEIGAVGMFSAILISILTTEVYRTAIQRKWTIKMPSSVPQLVSDSFSSFIPVVCALMVAFFIRVGFDQVSYGSLNNFVYQLLQQPLTLLGSSLPATIVVAVLINLFWFFGLHGHVIVGSVMVPVWTAQAAENLAAFQSGKDLPNIVTTQFIDFFVINGGFVSIPILISLLVFFKKRKEWRELGKIALAPGIFGVYEPLIFGLPVMLNPILFLPLLLTPVITSVISYLAFSSGFVAFTTGVTLPYTVPLVISGAIVTNSITGSILQILLLVILTVMWYTFLKVLDIQKMKAEFRKEETE